MVVITAKQAALWDKSMKELDQMEKWEKSTKGLDNMRKVKVIKAMPEMEVGKIMESDGEEMMQFRCGCFGMSLNIRDLIRGGWLEEAKEESLVDKIQKIFNRERGMYNSANAWEKTIKVEISSCANKHYEKEVVDAMNKATSGVPISVDMKMKIPMDEVLSLINKIKQSVADVFKDKE